MKDHHDYPWNGFALFAAYSCGWIIFLFGLFQFRHYLFGTINTLRLMRTLNYIIAIYTFFLLLGVPINSKLFSNGPFKKGLALIIPSVIAIILS